MRLHAAVAMMMGLLSSLPSCLAQSNEIESFYRGKQIHFLVGSDPGGGYDLLARLVARHIGSFIPGNPALVVENMPGAGSILLSNRIFNTAPNDGTYVGLVQRGVLLAEFTGQPNVHFELNKFFWMGNVTSEEAIGAVSQKSGIKSLSDLMTREVLVGGTGPTSDTEASARMLTQAIGTKFRLVSGYPGTSDVLLAVQRGELDGVADLSWNEIKTKNANLLKSGTLIPILRHGGEEIGDLPGLPNPLSMVKLDEDRQALNVYYDLKRVARPIMIGPKVPPARVSALQGAFEQMIASKVFQDDAIASGLTLHPSNHEALEQFVKELTSVSPSTKSRIKAILNVSK